MAKILPFKALRYNDNILIQNVIAPPYDVISAIEKKHFASLSPHNAIHFILSQSKQSYKAAKNFVTKLIANNTLSIEERNSIYILEQTFDINHIKKVRIGIIALLDIAKSAKQIYKHERTFESHTDDRYSLLNNTKTFFDQIFAFHNNKKLQKSIAETVSRATLCSEFNLNGIKHRLFKIEDDKHHRFICQQMDSENIFIADGHHRLEAAALYFRNKRNLKLVPFYITCADDNMVILPTYRTINNIKKSTLSKIESIMHKYFDLSRTDRAETQSIKMTDGIFTTHLTGKNATKHSAQELLQRLNKAITELKQTMEPKLTINYTSDEIKFHQNLQDVNSIGFIPPQIAVEDIIYSALNNRPMPHKSTNFYPKLPSGMIIYKTN